MTGEGESSEYDRELAGRARRVKLLLMDCDGVLTDGRLYFSEAGEAMKVFHVRDGQGLARWHASGFRSGIITGRGSDQILRKRIDELGIHHLVTRSEDKAAAIGKILDLEGLTDEEVAYVGDDLGDIAAFDAVGFPLAVADAHDDVLDHVIYVTGAPGGKGAVREVIDLLLRIKAGSEDPEAL